MKSTLRCASAQGPSLRGPQFLAFLKTMPPEVFPPGPAYSLGIKASCTFSTPSRAGDAEMGAPFIQDTYPQGKLH